jgi:hypothetical protein
MNSVHIIEILYFEFIRKKSKEGTVAEPVILEIFSDYV